jgi:superfamily II DNA or RNA helicase
MELRPYQVEAVNAVMHDLTSNHTLGVIAPTGAGKTVMMMEIAERYLDTLGHGYSVIIVSHLSILQSQTLDGFIRHCKHRATKHQGREKADTFARIIVTTMQTIRNEKSYHYLKHRLIHNKTALMMIDEAQMYGARSYQTIEDKFECKVIGFSASPYRGNKYSFNQFDTVSYAISLQELIDQGYLVAPRLQTIDLAGMSVAERISHIAGLIATLRSDKIEGSLVYWNTKADAELASNTFNACDIRSAFITDDTTKARKKQILSDFETGTINVIHNVNILSAGYDSNKVYNIFLPMGTSSPVNYIQRIGRGLRKEEGKTHCNVYCYGDAPTIKRGLYHKIHRVALKTKDDPDLGKQGDIYDTLEWLELNPDAKPDKIRYTRELVAACERVKTLGMDNLARMIRFKKFPKRYLRSLITSQAKIDLKEKGQPTHDQSHWLKGKGFDETQIATLNRAEATALVAMIQSRLNTQWVIREGLHTNKTIDEVPMAYIGALVKKRQYNHPVLKLYNSWRRAGRPET